MAAVPLYMQGTSLNDSIFSLLDQYWYGHSILSATLELQTAADNAREIGSGEIDEGEMRKVFDRFDDNGDGVISGEELRRHLSCCGKDISDAEASSMVACVDGNRDGGVDFKEFLSLYQSEFLSSDGTGQNHERADWNDQEEAMLAAFSVFDRNNDGYISAQELQTVLLSLGMLEGKSLMSCEKMIHVVDRDGDGRCNIREFQEMMYAKSSELRNIQQLETNQLLNHSKILQSVVELSTT